MSCKHGLARCCQVPLLSLVVLAQAEEQIRAGQVRPAEDALQELAEK